MGKLTCYAHGHPGAWEAICVDLDIAVAGGSLEEVMASLAKAIQMHVEAANEMEERDRAVLLSRKAPLHVRLSYLLAYLWSRIRSSGDDELHAGFDLASPA